jgi:cytochrome P450
MATPLEDALPAGLMPSNFDAEYVAYAVEPFLLSGRYLGETPSLPMIDLAFSKEKAIDPHMWGLLYDGWQPNPEAEGTSVFIRGYDQRGPDNERKRIYASATTPDLVATKYGAKMDRFFEGFLAAENAGKPLMHEFYEHYFDLYWDLHLGVRGEEIPPAVRQFGTSFNAVLGFRYPTLDVVREHYMRVRATRKALKEWVDRRVQVVLDGNMREADRTLVYYWLKNGGQGENFRRKDIVFECFHNLLAFSQLGNTVYRIMGRLEASRGDPAVKAWLARTMKEGPDEARGGAFTPLDRFVMELFRTIAPNAGSLSALERQRHMLGATYSTIVTPHLATNRDARHWSDPDAFDPDRYKTAPTSADHDEAKAKEAGLARSPFRRASFAVKDGRKVEIENSAYGAVYPVIDGKAHPVCDAGGYAPFGLGYRRCAGEHLTVEFVKKFVRAAWAGGLEFVALGRGSTEQLPVGPGIVIEDDVAFERVAKPRPERREARPGTKRAEPA